VAKRVLNSDVIEPDLFGETIKSGLALKTILLDIKGQMASILTQSRQFATSGTFGSVEGINQTTEAYKKAKIAGDAYERTDRMIADTEKRLEVALTEKGKQLAAVRLELERATTANKEHAKAVSDTTGPYMKASNNLSKLIKDYQNLAVVNKANTVEAKALLIAIQAQDAELKKIDATVGRHQRSVGHYASATYGLRGSLNQITREMPAFANSLNTGFMAISNNIPMLVDEINRLVASNKELNAQGEKTPSVFSSIKNALLSWQTALSVGVTLLTIYGGKLVESIASGFGYRDATKAMKEEQERYNETLDDTIKKTNTLIESQKDEITFQTEALVIEAKKRNATQDEIDEIRAKGRDKEILKLQDHQERTTSIWSHHWTKLKEAEVLFNTDKAKFQELYNGAKDREAKAAAEKDKADAAVSRAISKNALDDRTAEYEAQKALEEKKKKEAEEAKKKAIADLEFQHDLNQTRLMGTKDNMIRERLLLEEQLDFQLAMNEIIIEDNKKRDAMTLALEVKFQEDIRVLWNKYEVAAEEHAIKINQVSGEKLFAETERNRKKIVAENKKRAKAEEKAMNDLLNKAENLLDDSWNRRLQKQEKAIDKELDAAQRRRDDLRKLAILGYKDANDSLALQERKEAELEAKREKLARAKYRRELAIATVRMLSGNSLSNPGQAGDMTADQINKALNRLNSFTPAFLEGTEDTGEGGSLDEHGGFHAILHKRERVVPEEENLRTRKPDGSLMSNRELVDRALMTFNLTSLSKIPLANPVDDRQVETMNGIREDLHKVKRAIEKIPVPSFEYDQFDKMMIDRMKYEHTTKVVRTRLGQYRG
jgi:hypothetical protein